MQLDEALEITDIITHSIMQQYEEVHSLGPCNMLDYNCVMRAADGLGFYALASLTKEGYILILENFSALMKHHRIEQQ